MVRREPCCWGFMWDKGVDCDKRLREDAAFTKPEWVGVEVKLPVISKDRFGL